MRFLFAATLATLVPLLSTPLAYAQTQPQAQAQPQSRASVPAPLASASRDDPPPRQRPSPEAQRNSATAPGEMRPERPALPQVAVPLGTPAPEPTVPKPARLSPGASSPGVSDAVARCEAKTSAAERQRCRRELSIQAPAAAPQR